MFTIMDISIYFTSLKLALEYSFQLIQKILYKIFLENINGIHDNYIIDIVAYSRILLHFSIEILIIQIKYVFNKK